MQIALQDLKIKHINVIYPGEKTYQANFCYWISRLPVKVSLLMSNWKIILEL
jgi:SH3-like domain-containing protein